MKTSVSVISKTPEVADPFVMGSLVVCGNAPDLIVLVHRKEGDEYFEGVVISGGCDWRIGAVVSIWRRSLFQPFTGTVTLTSE